MRNIYIKYLLVILMAFSSKLLLAGGSNCVAAYTYTIDTEVSYFTYLFQDSSVSSLPIVSHAWDFGDGVSSTNVNPEHQYLQEGDYLVSLSIVCSDGSVDSYSETIHVQKVIPPSCAASFTFKYDSLQANYTYLFTDHSVSPNDTIISWWWDFGDGSPLVNTQYPQHQYLSPGIYVTTLSITTAQSFNSSTSETVYVNASAPLCDASFSFYVDSISGNPQVIGFINESSSVDSIISYCWNFGDGDTSFLENPLHYFPNQGVYDVHLSILTSGGCSSSTHYLIQVGNPMKYNLWGRVYLGNLTTDKCIALLYKELNNGFIIPVDTVRLTSVNDTLGVYYFYQVLEGMHKVKIILPESSNYDKLYAPTYYGDDLFWNMTSSINLNTDLSLMNVNMKNVVQQVGNCQISGSVMKNNSGYSMEGVQVLLLDNYYDVFAYTFTDSLGEYTFEDVPIGNFQVYAELTGLYSIPASVFFNVNNDTLSNVNVYLSKYNSMVSIDKPKESVVSTEFRLFPNPVTNSLNIEILKGSNIDYKYQIINNIGQTVSFGNMNANGINTIDVRNLHSGMYLISIFSQKKGFILSKKFIHK